MSSNTTAALAANTAPIDAAAIVMGVILAVLVAIMLTLKVVQISYPEDPSVQGQILAANSPAQVKPYLCQNS